MPRRSSTLKDRSARGTLVNLISSNKVLIFGHSHCYYSLKAKDIISSVTSKYTFFACDTDSHCAELRDEVLSTYGHRTFPAVFINGRFVGGADSVEALQHSGELKKMVGE